MGHEGYLGGAYNRVEERDARKFYLENEPPAHDTPPALSEKDRENVG